jgi:thiol-disulfide isomerase/thioredoxin
MKQILKFSANMCGACRRYEKTFDAIKYELPDYEFIAYDATVDRDKFEEYQITGMPTTVIIDNGIEKKRVEGYLTVEELHKFVSNEKL